ncbi:hypothetical protein MTO96_048021 [Rhipicephalus appendiculatus]
MNGYVLIVCILSISVAAAESFYGDEDSAGHLSQQQHIRPQRPIQIPGQQQHIRPQRPVRIPGQQQHIRPQRPIHVPGQQQHQIPQHPQEPEEPEAMPRNSDPPSGETDMMAGTYYGYYGGSEDAKGQDMRPLEPAHQEGRMESEEVGAYDAYEDFGEERSDEATFEEDEE